MQSFTIKLDPATKEELTSDLSTDFVLLLLMEAVLNSTDPISEDNDQDEMFEDSVTLLMSLLEEDETGDCSTEGRDSPELNELVSDKLSFAIASIKKHNKEGDLIVICEALKKRGETGGIDYSTTFVGDTVVFCVATNKEVA